MRGSKSLEAAFDKSIGSDWARREQDCQAEIASIAFSIRDLEVFGIVRICGIYSTFRLSVIFEIVLEVSLHISQMLGIAFAFLTWFPRLSRVFALSKFLLRSSL